MRFFWSIIAILFIAVACDDEQSDIGFEIQPPEDHVEVKAASFELNSKTIVLDSMFIKTDTAFLGQYTDRHVGTIKNDFLVQLSCMKNFKWHTKMIGRPDSVALKLYYSGYFGDSLASMNVVVYELTKKLENKKSTYYTNINPDEYCDYTTILGEKTFTAANKSLSDSIKGSSEYDGPYIIIPLKKELINRFYDQYNAQNFTSTSTFTDFFKGLYITTNMGDGCILYIDDVYMQFYFDYKDTDEYNTTTDTLKGAATFAYNKEVILSNHLVQQTAIDLNRPNDTVTYIKSPIGAVTQIDIPVKAIKETVGENTPLNTVKLEITADPIYETGSNTYMSYQPPYKLMLLPKEKLTSFFENGDVYDNKTSYLASYNSASSKYTFSNISKLLANTNVDTKEMVLIPVTTYTDSSTGLVTKVKPLYTPSITRLKKKNCNNRPLKLNVIYSLF